MDYHCDCHQSQETQEKVDGYTFYKKVLKSPKYIVAPMVEQSELAWRMFARNHGAHLCFSPMYSANTFVSDITYKKKVKQSSFTYSLMHATGQEPINFHKVYM